MEHEFCWYSFIDGLWLYDIEYDGYCDFAECPTQDHRDHKHFGEH